MGRFSYGDYKQLVEILNNDIGTDIGVKKSYHSKDIVNLMNEKYSMEFNSRNVMSLIGYMGNSEDISITITKEGKVNLYTFKRGIKITLWYITKNKNMLYFYSYNSDYKEPVASYNFITDTYDFKNILNEKEVKKDFEIVKNSEWLFNYSNNLIEVCKIYDFLIKEYPEYLNKEPKGFSKYLKEHIEYDSFRNILEEYIIRNKNSEFMANINEYSKQLFSLIKKFDLEKDTIKMCNNSIKKGLFDDIRGYRLVKMFSDYEQLIDANIVYNFDTNRDIAYNLKNIENLLNAEKNNILAKQLQKLNFINKMSKYDLSVIVPQTQEEKIAEGKMQNNCVGSYYDTQIIRGEYFIYFIRKNDSLDKSYITCRYDKSSKKTVEYRAINNSNVKDNDILEFIREIDNIINDNYDIL